jgi:hypothetical protein
MVMKNVTELQYKMLCKIIEDDYTPSNGNTIIALIEEGEAYTFVNQVIESAQDRGTVTSLQNAGLVDRHKTGTADDCIWLTDDAIELMKSRYTHSDRFCR